MSDDDPLPWVVLHFDDGTELHARPGVEADVVDMLHDATHHILAKAMGVKKSPALEVALGHATHPDVLLHAEEAAVLAVQNYLRVLIDP